MIWLRIEPTSEEMSKVDLAHCQGNGKIKKIHRDSEKHVKWDGSGKIPVEDMGSQRGLVRRAGYRL